MKYLIGLLLFSSQAFAVGKIQIQTSYHPKSKDYGHMVGLVVAEHLMPKLMYVQWTGLGQRPFSAVETQAFFATRHDLEYACGRVAFALGVGMNHGGDEVSYKDLKVADYNVHARVTYQLW